MAARASRRRPAAAWTLQFAAAPSPAGDASAQPQLTASDGGVILSWLENASSQTALKFSERTAAGWSEPRLVAFGDDFFANFADVPSVVRLADRTLVAHWLQMNGASASGYDLRLARSSDDGRTWSAPFSPHHDGTKTQHGFASLFDTGGGLGVVWLDGRAMKPGAGPDDEGTGDMGLRSARFDRDGSSCRSWRSICASASAAPPASAVTIDGPIVAYRNRSADEVRDIYVSRFTGEGGRCRRRCTTTAGRSTAARSTARRSARGRAASRSPGSPRRTTTGTRSSRSRRTRGAPSARRCAWTTRGSLGRVDVEQLADGSAVVGWIELAGGRRGVQGAARRAERSAVGGGHGRRSRRSGGTAATRASRVAVRS